MKNFKNNNAIDLVFSPTPSNQAFFKLKTGQQFVSNLKDTDMYNICEKDLYRAESGTQKLYNAEQFCE